MNPQNDSYSLETLNDFKVFATIANEAIVNENNRLNLIGAGVNHFLTALDATAPYTIDNLGIGLFMTIPWAKTDQDHIILLRLVDEDSRPVKITGVNGQTDIAGDVSLSFNVHRDHLPAAGSEVELASALNIGNLTLNELGRYTLLVLIDEIEYTRLHFTLSRGTI